MNLQHLRHFVAIAEERHFGRAARRLNMAQPPLSQSLARLEASLGLRLVDRTRRSVALTAAGETFLREVRPAIQQLDRAVRMADKASAGQLGLLNIGFVSSALAEAIPTALRQLAKIAPESEISLHELSTEHQLDALLEGKIDVGFIYSHIRHEADIRTLVIARYGFQIAMPAEWPLSAKERLDLRDLDGLPFILFPYEQRPDLRAMFLTACRAQDVELNVAQDIARTQTAISLVAGGLGMALAADATVRQGFPGVVFRPIDGLPEGLTLDLSMAWPANGATPSHEAALAALAAWLDPTLPAR